MCVFVEASKYLDVCLAKHPVHLSYSKLTDAYIMRYSCLAQSPIVRKQTKTPGKPPGKNLPTMRVGSSTSLWNLKHRTLHHCIYLLMSRPHAFKQLCVHWFSLCTIHSFQCREDSSYRCRCIRDRSSYILDRHHLGCIRDRHRSGSDHGQSAED